MSTTKEAEVYRTFVNLYFQMSRQYTGDKLHKAVLECVKETFKVSLPCFDTNDGLVKYKNTTMSKMVRLVAKEMCTK